MKRVFLALAVSLFSVASSPAEQNLAERMSRIEFENLARTRGFVLGQKHSLNLISEKYAFLRTAASFAERGFMLKFGASIANMDQQFIDTFGEDEFKKFKEKALQEISSSMKNSDLSEEEAQQFIQVVRDRANGDIESPILETMLIFNPDYAENPHREFLDGYRYKYSHNGEGKAKGIGFSLYIPKSWQGKEGERPNVIRQFTNQNGHGFASFNIVVRNRPFLSKSHITEKDIDEMLDPAELQDIVPENAVVIGYGKVRVETLLGLRVEYRADQIFFDHPGSMEIIHYYLFYKKKVIVITGGVAVAFNGIDTGTNGLKKYKKLFQLMANSLVIPSIWTQ